jgi:transglutaminase-like putative cysteine protease
MSKYSITITRLFILIFLLLTPVSTIGVDLKASVNYTNSTNFHVKNVVHKLTIPPNTSYQRIIKIHTVDVDKWTISSHKNGIDKYISFGIDIPPNSSSTKQIIFTLEKIDLSFSQDEIQKISMEGSLGQFLRPSKNIESDAKQIRAVAKLIVGGKGSLGEQLKLAYEFPGNYLKFQPQKHTSALTALRTGSGDCTEYAYLFVAISRNLGIPARVISGFFYEENKSFTMPNHHASEIYTAGHGWVPVFPNLGTSKYSTLYELGKNPQSFITLKRSDVWTWSNILPKDLKGKSADIAAAVSWEIDDASK